VQRDSQKGRTSREGAPADASDGAGAGQWWDGSDCAATLTKQNANGAQRMPDKDNLGAVLTPTAFSWQNARDGLRQDDAVGSLRSSAGDSGFHEMNHPVVMQAHGFYSTGGTHGVNQHPEVSPAVKVGSGLGIPSPPEVAHALRGEGFDASEDGTGRGTPLVPVAMRESGQGYWMQDEISGSLRAEGEDRPSRPSHVIYQQSMTVRRLTPRECERLQAFPDDYTLIPWRKKPADQCPDGPRYKALGNSMAVNCMEWIGERIAAYERDAAEADANNERFRRTDGE